MKHNSKFRRFGVIQRRVRISLLMIIVGLLVLWYGIQLMESHTGLDRPVMIIAAIWLVFWIVFMVVQIRLLTRERKRILLSEVNKTEDT